VFGHPKGHITRCLANVKRDLQARFAVCPDLLGFNDPLFEPDWEGSPAAPPGDAVPAAEAPPAAEKAAVAAGETPPQGG
jgi:hypothetical protein